MGYWGFGIYENDDAHGWANELVEVGNISVIEKYLDNVLLRKEKSDEYDASDALAAVDALTRIDRQYPFSDDHPEKLIDWLSTCNQRVPLHFYSKAKKVLLFINSESCQLFRLIESVGEEYFDGWRATVQELGMRLDTCASE